MEDKTRPLTIWVDADACPKPIKALVFRASDRLNIPVFLVANGFLQNPPHPNVTVVQVSKGFDVADHVILERMEAGDLVTVSYTHLTLPTSYAV